MLSAKPKKERRKNVAIAPRGVEAAKNARYFLQSARGRFVFSRDTANAMEVGAINKWLDEYSGLVGLVLRRKRSGKDVHLCGRGVP